MMKPAFTYKAHVLNVVDGDTIDVEIDLGFDIFWKTRIRLNGIDTPEINSTSQEIRNKAAEAKSFVRSAIWGRDVVLVTYKPDKYGRYLADVHLLDGDKSINTQLVEAQLAVPYFGGSRA